MSEVAIAHCFAVVSDYEILQKKIVSHVDEAEKSPPIFGDADVSLYRGTATIDFRDFWR